VVNGCICRWLGDTKVCLQYPFEGKRLRLGCWIMRIHACKEKEPRFRQPMLACKPVEGCPHSFTRTAFDSPPDHSPVVFVAGMH
jgi:hypothetical protein